VGIKSFEATLDMKSNAFPKFCKARTVLFVLKEVIEQELNHLEQDGVIEKITYTPWTVAVPKRMGISGCVVIIRSLLILCWK